MSYKITCPGCDAHTSGVGEAERGERDSCPHCGLPAETIQAVIQAQKRHQDSQLRELYERAEVRAGQLDAEVRKLRRAIAAIRSALSANLEDDWSDSA